MFGTAFIIVGAALILAGTAGIVLRILRR